MVVHKSVGGYRRSSVVVLLFHIIEVEGGANDVTKMFNINQLQ